MLPVEEELNAFLPLSEPATVRLRFTKTGPLQFISHLDLQRTFGRILSRADLPLWFTQGFNPHPKLVFALPLPIGCESVCEAADIRIVRDMPCEEMLRRLNLASVENLRFFDCYRPERKFDGIAYASYTVSFDPAPDAVFPEPEEISRFLLTPPVIMKKKTKSGERDVDIVPMIKSVSALREEDGPLVLRCLLSAAEGASLSPELVVSALREKFSLPSGIDYSIMRTGIFDAEGKEFR